MVIKIKPIKSIVGDKKKSNNVKPTARQKKAFKNIVENGGNKGEELVKAGYSKETAKSPKKVTDSRGWKELLSVYLPDSDLAKKHKELLNAKQIRTISFNRRIDDETITEIIESEGFKVIKIVNVGEKLNDDEDEETDYYQMKKCFYSVPDTMARDKALDKAYKVKKMYTEDTLNNTIEEIMKKNLKDRE